MAADPARAIARNDSDVEAAFDAAPPILVAEIMNGVLHLQPRPARPHTNVASRLGMLIGPPFQLAIGGPGGWVILDEPELHFGPGPDKLSPDLAGWRRTRMPDAVGGDLAPAHYDLAPDWICEVLSRSTSAIDRGEKMPIYAREGVPWIWLVDPLGKTIEVHRLAAGTYQLDLTFRGERPEAVPPFEALPLDLALLWAT